MSTEAAKYFDRYGKLDETITIAVDRDFKDRVDRLRSKKVKFAEWARDVLYARITELEESEQSQAS